MFTKGKIWIIGGMALGMMLLGTRAQEVKNIPSHYVQRAYSVGVGSVDQLDTYLSPMAYTGTALCLTAEQFGRTSFACPLFSQGYWVLEGSYTHSASQKGSQFSGFLDGMQAYPYRLFQQNGWQLFVGPQARLRIGGVYNLRNSNNPAQLTLAASAGAMGQAVYDFTLWRRTFRVRFLTDVPLAGLQFSPDHQQSYYEIFYLGDTHGVVAFTSLHNHLCMRNLLSLDIPLPRGQVRIGFVNDMYQSDLRGIRSRFFTQSFTVGYVQDLYRVGSAERQSHPLPY